MRKAPATLADVASGAILHQRLAFMRSMGVDRRYRLALGKLVRLPVAQWRLRPAMDP